MMTEKEQVEAKNEEVKQEPKEQMVNLIELLEKYKASAINEVRRDFREFAYRLYSVELVMFKFLTEKRKENLDKDLQHSAEIQEDILIANVKIMLERMATLNKELEDKIKKEAEK